MWRKWLNLAGLVIGLLGVFALFVWGPPQSSFETGMGIGLEPATVIPGTNRTVAQNDQDVLNAKAFTTVMSRLGLGVVALGFVLQIIAAFPEDALGWQLVLVRTRRTEMDP